MCLQFDMTFGTLACSRWSSVHRETTRTILGFIPQNYYIINKNVIQGGNKNFQYFFFNPNKSNRLALWGY